MVNRTPPFLTHGLTWLNELTDALFGGPWKYINYMRIAKVENAKMVQLALADRQELVWGIEPRRPPPDDPIWS